MTNWNLRILTGLLLSAIWVFGNLAFASTANPQDLAWSPVLATPIRSTTVPHSTQPPTATTPNVTPAGHTPPPTSSIRPVEVATPIELPAEPSGVPTITPPLPTSGSSERQSLQVPAMIVPTPTVTTPVPQEYANSMTGDQYRYFERSQDVIALQVELGMRSVDGIYGPDTRKAHVDALGGPTAVLYRNYPEIGQTPIPCSLAHEPEKTTCGPGDGHYELPTLGALIDEYFEPEDRALARMIAFCESSGQTHDIGSEEVSSALAIGWFQHLAKYWQERSEKAGFTDYDPFNGRANVGVAAWLYYTSGVHHWNPSRTCWEQSSY